MTEPTQNIKIKYHNPKMPHLVQKEDSDWIDMRINSETVLLQGEFKILSLGISMEIPLGFEAHIVPRSSTFKTWGIIQTNGTGIIDNKFRGNDDVWGMPVYATRDVKIEQFDRICQFRIQLSQKATILQKLKWLFNNKIELEYVFHLENTARDGFGSTNHSKV